MLTGEQQRKLLGGAWTGTKHAATLGGWGLQAGVAGGRVALMGGELGGRAFVGAGGSFLNYRRTRLGKINDRKSLPIGHPDRINKTVEGNFFPKSNQNAYHSFGHRGSREHLRKSASTWARYTALSGLGIGANVAFAAMESDDNIFDPQNGMARSLARTTGEETGFVLGGGVGAAAAVALLGPGALVAGAGWLLGAAFGSGVGGAVGDAPWALASYGARNSRGARQARRSTFLDSDHAATMRQRSQNSIHQHQMNARSAFGSEALALHG